MGIMCVMLYFGELYRIHLVVDVAIIVFIDISSKIIQVPPYPSLTVMVNYCQSDDYTTLEKEKQKHNCNILQLQVYNFNSKDTSIGTTSGTLPCITSIRVVVFLILCRYSLYSGCLSIHSNNF